MFGLQGPACALSIGPRWDSVNTDRDATIFKNAQTLLHIWNSIGAAYTVGHNTPKSRKGKLPEEDVGMLAILGDFDFCS